MLSVSQSFFCFCGFVWCIFLAIRKSLTVTNSSRRRYSPDVL